MSDIISKWLTETLGIIVEVYSETFVRLVQNGYLIGAILRHYNIITADHLSSLTAAGDSVDSLDKISVWLKKVNIELDDETKKQLEKGKISTTLELFYKLYLVFQGKDPLHYTAKHVQTQNIRDVNDRFVYSPVENEVPASVDIDVHPLSASLNNYRHIVQWHHDRYLKLLQRCDQQRQMYNELMATRSKIYRVNCKSLAGKEVLDADVIPQEDVLSLNEGYELLMEQQTRAQQLDAFVPDANVTKRIVKGIKRKYDKERVNAAFQAKMESMVLAQFWSDLDAWQTKQIESNVAQKLLKQSYIEKQMTNKMFEIREQKEIITENRTNVLKEIQNKRDFELIESIFANEKESVDERYRYYFERDRALELHRRLYEEKQRLKVQRKVDICRNVVEDMVNVAIRCGEYKENFEEELPQRMKSDLYALFISNQPIFDLVPNEEVIVAYEPLDDEAEEIYIEEIDRHNAMDIRNFERYCNFEWPWELEIHVPDYAERDLLRPINMAMNVLGHIVFRLLLAKYPKPPQKPPPDIPKVQMAACIASISDLTILPILSKLLSERKVAILQMEDAINFCLEAYKDETTEEYPESQFVDETEEALTKVANKKTKKKDKVDKKERKKKGEKKNKKKKKPDVVESLIELPSREVQVQTPRIFPGDEPLLSPAAELGRLAYEILNLGEALNDKLLVQMLVEYLKTLKKIDGWCLINYPTNVEQMCLLEESLTSKPVLLTADSSETKTQRPSIRSGEYSATSGDLQPLFCANNFTTDERTNEEFINAEHAPEEEEAVPSLTKLSGSDRIEDIADLDYREVKQNNQIEDLNAQYRVSRLLTNPDPPITIEDYDCYLTAFIRMIQDEQNVADGQPVEYEPDYLDLFYQCQGCLYSLYYKILDFATIKHIGKLIVGDYTLPPKSSVQIFGDTVLYLENDMNQSGPTPGKTSTSKFGGKKKEKPPKPRKAEKKEESAEKKEKGGKKDKKGKKSEKSSSKSDKKSKKGKKGKKEVEIEEPDIVITREDKETQIPELPPEAEDTTITLEREPTPGEPNWKYSDLPLPDFFQVALATLWENLEEVYVCDFRELFFRWRIVWKLIMPYLTFVRRYMKDFIERPDDKQVHLYNFQRLYNDIDADMRDDDELKAELHCRIHEFGEKMRQICDTRMRESEEERQAVIKQDWMTKQVCELLNLYLIAMQLEIDRSADTFQLLNDYYVAMITKMPCAEDVLEKHFLNYVVFKDDLEFENCEAYGSFVRRLLTNAEEEKKGVSPYHTTLYDNHANATKTADQYRDKSVSILSGMEAYFQPKGKKNKPKKDTKGKAKGKMKLPKFSAPDPEVKDVGLKLIAEWQCAINGEHTRVCLRLDLLKSEAECDLRNLCVASRKTFHGLYFDIKERYGREINSVKECCDVLHRAVEEEMSIQPELVLKDDNFYINPEVRLFEDDLPEPEPLLKEYERPEAFTIAQLSYITDVLFDLAPSGIIPERSFIFLLQDLIVNNAEDGASSLMPELWRQISPHNMNKLSYRFFGHAELIDWKDFIIYNLCIEFPDENELMQTRRQFREFDVDSKEYVYDYQFDTVRFWFESQFDLDDPRSVLRLREMKTLLQKLYKIDAELINYTALLLAFCKDEEPNKGLAKALQLSLGKFVCWDVESGEAFIAILRQQQLEELQHKMQMEMEVAEKLDTVGGIMDTLIDTTVHQCDSCYLESYCSVEEASHNSKDEFMDQELVYLENLMKEYERQDSVLYEENAPLYFLHEEFSNAEIGFEPEFYPSKVYYLPFDVVLTVMLAAMPWKAISKNDGEPTFRQTLEELYENSRNKEFENMVLTHEFLNSDALKDLLERYSKFAVKKPHKIISELLENR